MKKKLEVSQKMHNVASLSLHHFKDIALLIYVLKDVFL